MTAHEFDQQMQRLEDVYGARAYPSERRSLIWKEFGEMHGMQFERLISRLISEFAQAPMLPRFREIAASFRENQVARDKAAFSETSRDFTRSLSGWIKKAIDAGNMSDLSGFIDLFGQQWVEQKYNEACATEQPKEHTVQTTYKNGRKHFTEELEEADDDENRS